MTIEAELADGRILEFPDGTDPTVIQSTVQRLITPPAPSTDRTWGEATKDLGASLVEGVGGLAQFPGQVYGLTTGAITNPDFATTGLYGAGKQLEAYGAGLKSKGLQAREAASEAKVTEAAKEGEVSAFLTQLKEIATDPAQLPTFLIKQSVQAIPSILVSLVPFVGPEAAIELRSLQLAAKTATTLAAREAAEVGISKIAANAAAKQALGVAAVQQGADIGSGTYEDAYKHLVQTGVPAPEAADQALSLARKAGASAAVISALAQSLPGAQAMERAIAGERRGATGRVMHGLGIGTKEALTEVPEELGGRTARNAAMMQIDPNQTLTEGLGATAGQAAIGGFGMGAVTGVATGKPPSDAPSEVEKTNAKAVTDFEERKNKRLAEINAATPAALPAEPETVTPTKAPSLLALPAPEAPLEEQEAKRTAKAETEYRDTLDQLKTESQATGIADFSPEEIKNRLTNIFRDRYEPLPPAGAEPSQAPALTPSPQMGQAAQAFYDRAVKHGDLEVTTAPDATTRVVIPAYETKLPNKTSIREEAFKAGEEPSSYAIRSGDSVLSQANTAVEAQAKADRITAHRQTEAARIQKQIDGVRSDAKKNQDIIERMEALGESQTPAYAESVANHEAFKAEADTLLPQLDAKLQEFQNSPVTVEPMGMRPITRPAHTVYTEGKPSVSFPTRTAAEAHVLSNLEEKELKKLAEAKIPHKLTERAKDELQARLNAEAGLKAARTAVSRPTREAITGVKENIAPTTEIPLEHLASIQQLEKILLPLLKKMGLGHIGLDIVRSIQNNADGSYAAKLIQIAFDAKDPIGVLRHETIHALKELGFFTPQQWKALEDQAIKVWIEKYLTNVNQTMEDGTVISRLQAYKNMGLTNEDLMEEAIADAFADFNDTQAPSGLLTALLNRLRMFFNNLRSALTGAGYDSAEEVFGKISRGELTEGTSPAQVAEAPEKLSLSGAGVPLSTRQLMEQNTPYANNAIGLQGDYFYRVYDTKSGDLISTHAKEAVAQKKLKKHPDYVIRKEQINNVRDIGVALNNDTRSQYGAMDRQKHSIEEEKAIANAMADEVAYQLETTSATGTGQGWYSVNYPNAVKRLGQRFPELQRNKFARSVFSALVAITSNGERVEINIDNAIELYADLRKGVDLVPKGNRRPTALAKNLEALQKVIQKHGVNFEQELMREITVREMNAHLRSLGEKTDASYLANTRIPAAAIYFGPKLGAFYANLSGSEGYLTMDLWWSRSINRMRGLLQPKATDESISKFRAMMGEPNATREQVIAAAMPFRDKYAEYGYVTELEYRAGSKEPTLAKDFPKWLLQAKRKLSGVPFKQLFIEHQAEKMANTIIKNEYEMLQEAPFGAGDRAFMYRAARRAQALLADQGTNLSLADIQAALWYYEKRLYAKLSGRPADDIGYEEAIIAQADKGDRREGPSVVFSGQPNGGYVPNGADRIFNGAGRIAANSTQGITNDTDTRSEEPTVRPSGGSGEGREKLSLSKSRSEQTGGGRGRVQSRSDQALEGAPHVEGASGPDRKLVSIVEQYAKEHGIPYERQAHYAVVDEELARKIAQAYEQMKNEPFNPKVAEAYQNMIQQVRQQYDALVDAGYTFTFYDGNSDPYDGNPWNAMRDLRKNKTMAVYGTYDGYGQEGLTKEALANNPMLENTGLKWEDQQGVKHDVTANDLFRAVHDALGHGIEGAGFRGQGEENAWQAHAKLFTGSALGALTSETRGQNSWLNFGPHGKANQTAKVYDTVFADQKVGLMPEWTWTSGVVKYSLKPSISLGTQQPDAISFSGVHYGRIKTDTLDASKYGTGLQGSEARRLSDYWDDRIKKRVYFYIPKHDGKMPLPESGVGGHVYTQTFKNIASPAALSKLYSEARGDSNTLETLLVDAGYDGYAAPSMGMMVILNHNVPVNYEGNKAEYDAKKPKLSLRAPDTAAFKQWFGDSKVVDKDGQPFVMYHGTPYDFVSGKSPAAFNTTDFGALLGKGAYFTADPKDAATYAGKAAYGGKPNILPVYISLQNPYIAKSVVEKVPKQSVLLEQGYDGILLNNTDGSVKWAVAFNPTQIKSATGNIGTYDATNPDIRYSLRDQLSQLPSAAAIAAQVQSTTFKRVEVGHGQRMIDALSPKNYSKYRQATLNRYNQIGVYGKAASKLLNDQSLLLADASAEAMALMSENAGSIAAEALGVGNRKGGQVVYKNGYFTVETGAGKKGAVEIFAPLAKKGDPLIYQYYQYWSGVKRGSRFLAEGREQVFTDPASIAYAAELETMFPEFVTVQKEWIKYNDSLVKMMVDAGVLTEAAGIEFTKHGDYLPFYRQLDGEKTVGPNIFQSIAGVKPPKKLKGGEAPLGDFLENVVRNTQASIEASMKNVAAQRAVRDAVTLGQATVTHHSSTGLDVVPVFEKGIKVNYQVTDPLWVEALQGLNLPAIPMLGIVAAPANLLRTMVTKDPAFMLANMLRDSLSTWITSGEKIIPVTSSIANMAKGLAGMSPIMDILHRAGVGGGFDLSGNVEESGREFSKTLRQATKTKTMMEKLSSPITGVWHLLEKGSEASEMSTRSAVYEATLKRTGNEAEAIYQAMEVLNFNRKGNSPAIRVLTAAVPFLNARMQGLDVLYRAGFGKNATKDVKAKQAAFFIRGATIMALSILYAMSMQDDDDYNKQEQEVKDNYWLFPKLGIKIPIPFELGIIFKVIPERIYSYAFGKDTAKDFRESMARQIVTTLSVNPVPQALMPYVEAQTNYSFFTQRPVVPRELADVAPKYQVTSSTSSLARRIGSTTGMSPIQIDHMISGYTGTMGMYMVQAMNSIFEGQNDPTRAALRMEQLPIWKRFALDKDARGQVSAYYELKHETDAMVRTVNILEASHQYQELAEYRMDNLHLLATQEYVRVLNQRMTELQKVKKQVESLQMDPEQKRDSLLALTQAQNAIASNTKTLRKIMSQSF